MHRPALSRRLALPVVLAAAHAAACADGAAAPAGPPDRPSAALVGGGGGTTPPPDTCTIVSCLDLVGGGPFAATRVYPEESPDPSNPYHDVVVLSPSGAVKKRLTTGMHYDYLPALSPDRTKMAFASSRGGGGVFVVNVADQAMTVLAMTDTSSTKRTVTGLSWSPDGKLVVFAARMKGKSDVYIARADGATLTQVTDDAYEEMSPVFTPDGGSLVFASTRLTSNPVNFELWRTTMLGNSPTRLTTTGPDERWPAFAPNGTLVFHRTNKAAGIDALLYSDGWGTNPTTVLSRPAADSLAHPSFSPDGAWLSFGTRDQATKLHAVWRVPAGTPGVAATRVTPVNVDYKYPRWSY